MNIFRPPFFIIRINKKTRCPYMPTRLWLFVLAGFLLCSTQASSLTIYRLGAPFSTAEKDSLQDLGFEIRELQWSVAQSLNRVELDSLDVGVLQPKFFGVDENMAATAIDRGGAISVAIFASDNNIVGKVLLDEDDNTAYAFREIAPESFNREITERLQVDLGGIFLIREVRFRPRSDHPGRFLERFRIGISDEPLSFFRVGTFPAILEIRENANPNVVVPFDPPITARTVQLQISRETPKDIELAEFEIFGGGFVTPARYESEIIELDQAASWGQINWSGSQDPNARVELRTRAGADRQPEIFWEVRPEQQDSIRYLQGGGTLDMTSYRKSYEGLPNIFKPKDERNHVTADTENWSFWSSVYSFENPGVEILSPGPHKFIQISADFLSTTSDGSKINYIEFKASPPTVHDLVGEIFPVETTVGEVTHFTYFIRPTIRSGDSGFDGVEIVTPSGVVSVDSLRIDEVNEEDFTWAAKEDGTGFEVFLPRKLETTDSGALVEVVFNAPVLREVGTFFDGKVFDSEQPNEVRQKINPGDAADEIESEQLSVRTTLSKSLVFAPRISPNPFTPNGDKINDAVQIAYTLLRVTTPVPVSIGIYDLSGSLVKEVYSGEDAIGEYERSWDGTDGQNQLVAPGIYIYRIKVDVQTQEEIQSGVVAVAY